MAVNISVEKVLIKDIENLKCSLKSSWCLLSLKYENRKVSSIKEQKINNFKLTERFKKINLIKDEISLLRTNLEFNYFSQHSKDVISKINWIKNNIAVIKYDGEYEFDKLKSSEEKLVYSLSEINQSVPSKSVVFVDSNVSEDNYLPDIIPIHKLKSKSISSSTLCVGTFNHMWNFNDHQIFLKVYKKFSNDGSRMFTALCSSLTHLSPEIIKEHVEMYQKYKENAEIAKRKIKEWKDKKESLQLQKLTTKENNDSKYTCLKKNNSKNIEQKRILIRKWKEKATIDSNLPSKKVETFNIAYTQKEREEIKEKLMMYKDEKAKYKLLKTKTNMSRTWSQEEIRRNLSEFREKDKIWLEKKRKTLNAANQNPMPKYVPLNSKPTGNYKRLTCSFLHKIASIDDNPDANKPVCVDYLPRKSMPNWRSN